jgi:hypothetical protein
MGPMTPEEANAYRQPVLDALGTDDPVEVQAAEVELWRRLLDDAGSALRARPAPSEWSALECLGHMADSEMVTSVRYRWVLAEDKPPLQGWDQQAWAARFDHSQGDSDALLALFAALRRTNLELWARTPIASRSRVGIHAERGPESFDLLFRLQAGHGRVHRAQAERALEDVRRAR